ncbi:apolipoprotein D [Aedes albopictus]|uniref:Lipocalin/cytosolic fatty-acid binding domain-containing protein n=2 Tax=Aedes albopictus TaxID=7160 RepID=A0ABM1YPU0_AEDAL|nr:apolipoprotein D-like [Aedes albopictus]
MEDFKCKVLLYLIVGLCGLASLVDAQIPGLGGCPDYVPITKFDRNKFLGTWYEVERYFTVSEVAAKCISATYELMPDGKIYVKNSLTNRFNNVERIISGVMAPAGKSKLGQYTVLYQSFPYNYNASFMILDTDYDNFAVIYSCSTIGPVGHTVSAWVLARERLPPGPILQRAYGVLDKYRINRSFFVRTHQEDCVVRPPPQPAIDPTEPSVSRNRDHAPGDQIETEEQLIQLRKDLFAIPSGINHQDIQIEPVDNDDNE